MSSVSRWLLLSFAVAGLLALYITSQAVDSVFAVLDYQDPLARYVPIHTLVGIVAGLITFVVLWKYKRANEFGEEVVKEVKKVTWPTMPETRAATIVVIVISIIISVVLGIFDFVFSTLTRFIYS